MNLKTLNEQLRTLNIGVAVNQRGKRLYLRATLPPKPGTHRGTHQQEISLGVYCNADGLQFAKTEAMKLGAALATRSFDWNNYLELAVQDPTLVKEWIRKYEEDYFNKRTKNSASMTTWDKDYRLTFEKLPQDELLTVENCLRLIGKTEPSSRARQRYVMALSSLCRFAGIEAKFSGLSKYSTKELNPRNIPSDKLIVEIRQQITDPAWRWVYGMLAVYGLRSHEVFLIDVDRLKSKDYSLYVKEGKTGARTVFPFPLSWWKDWELFDVHIPSVKANRNSDYGTRTAKKFKQYKIPFKAYDLRHRWAIRTLELGLDLSLSAQQMGHSHEIHSKIYHRWISEKTHQEAFERLQ
ncbi:MAG: site-specific integrase [Coleofasciculus sp. G3-WIS-01]|uniref:site-specific integrase n=1 Tax=Coleofasciculus sp. G3-WIS-01 TaxID=3069528 RepID=UPI0033006EC7